MTRSTKPGTVPTGLADQVLLVVGRDDDRDTKALVHQSRPAASGSARTDASAATPACSAYERLADRAMAVTKSLQLQPQRLAPVLEIRDLLIDASFRRGAPVVDTPRSPGGE